jgi:hypothetical protein
MQLQIGDSCRGGAACDPRGQRHVSGDSASQGSARSSGANLALGHLSWNGRGRDCEGGVLRSYLRTITRFSPRARAVEASNPPMFLQALHPEIR